MEWSEGVVSAITASKANKAPLLVLVEPPPSILSPPTGTPETHGNLYSRLATRALHDRLFSTPAICQTVRAANLLALRFPADRANTDFASFSDFFPIKQPLPNLYLISPDTGLVLYHLQGYVSPAQFQTSVFNAVKVVSSKEIDLPPLPASPVSHPPPPKVPAPASATTPPPAQPSLPPVVKPAAKPPTPQHAPPPTPPAAAAAPPQSSTSKSLRLGPQPLPPARLRARLPDGRQVSREFPPTTLFSAVRLWLASELAPASQPPTLLICTAFPRYVFSNGDNPKQLGELGLTPSATLVVALDGATPGGGGGPSPGAGVTGTASAVGSAALGTARSALYGVAGAAQVVAGFVRTFVTGTPQEVVAAREEAEAASTNGAPQQRQQREGGVGARPGQRDSRRGRVDTSNTDDDGNWMSNGNSTQFGWNGDDEQR